MDLLYGKKKKKPSMHYKQEQPPKKFLSHLQKLNSAFLEYDWAD